MRQINNVLARELRCKADTKALQRRMETHYDSEKATVTNKYTGEHVVLSERRNGSKYVFRGHVVDSLWRILKDPLVTSLRDTCRQFIDIQPELTHGDVIFYKEGGYFKWHRDSLYECPYEYQKGVEPKNFTFLLGLTTTKEGGETSIVFDDKGIHRFPQAKTESQFLLFHSDQLHSGEEITKGVKLVLKLEFWVWYRYMVSPCSCLDCQNPSSVLSLSPFKLRKRKQKKPQSESYKKMRLAKEKSLKIIWEKNDDEERGDSEGDHQEIVKEEKICLICQEDDIEEFCQRCSNGLCNDCYARLDKCPFCRFIPSDKEYHHEGPDQGNYYDQYISQHGYYDQDNDYDDWYCNGDC